MAEKQILLRDDEQLQKANLVGLYFESLFREDSAFKKDRQARIIFPVYHPVPASWQYEAIRRPGI